MGGINSGRRRSVHRGTVEQFPAIDLRILRRAGLLRPGECTYDTLRWQNQAPEVLSVRIFIDLSDTGDAFMRIISADGGTINQRVAIECIPCRYGGVRCYFICPLSGRRCEQFFVVNGIFASRKAHRLCYASQSEDELGRVRRKVRKLHGQVEGDTRYGRARGRNRYAKVQELKLAKHHAQELYCEQLCAIIKDIRK